MDCRFLFLLKGGIPQAQSLVFRLLGLALADRGRQVDYFHHPADPLLLEGVLVPSLAAGVLTAAHPAARELPFLQHLVVKEVDLPGGTVCLADHKEPFSSVLQIASGISRHLCPNLRAQLDEEVVAARAVGWVQELQEKEPYIKHYFAGTTAAEGVVCFIDHITGPYRKRYLLQGAPATGAVVMQDILIDALSRHFFVEVFHSWINPADLVVLVFPEIGVSVVDSTCGCKLKPLPDDVIWEKGETLRVSGIFRGDLPAETGKLLESSQKVLENDGRYLTEEELKPVVTMLIKEIMGLEK